MVNTKREATLIVSNFLYNSYLAGVVGGGFKEVTPKHITNFNKAREVLSIYEYRLISKRVTKRFKEEYNIGE